MYSPLSPVGRICLPRLNLNLRIKTVPVMAGTDATVYICMDYVLFTKVRNISLHLILS